MIEFRSAGRAVVGLHFGGVARQHNYAHAVARLEAVLAERGAKFQDA